MQQTLNRAGSVSLRQILPEGRFFGSPDIHVASCASEARACRGGDLFVALVGQDTDGHEQVGVALQRGAAAVLAERLLPVSVPQCVVPNTQHVFGRVCQRLAGDPSHTLRLVGVTGTHGKTTTSLLIAGVLRAAHLQTGTATTLGCSDSLEDVPAQCTTPHPPEMAHWLSRMRDNGCSHAVVEASSCGLVQHRLSGLGFDAVVLTNLRRDHLDLHGSVLKYRKAKMRLFAQLKPHGFAVLNADDPGSKLPLAQLDCPVMTFGMRSDAEVMGEVIERHSSEQTFLLMAGQDSVPVRTRMIGDHHVTNCLAAAAFGLVMGLDLTTVARGLESVEHLPGRLERVECGQPFSVFVDCADTADQLAVCLKTVRRVTRGRVLCVFGSERAARRDERPLLGRVLEKSTDLGVITSEGHETGEPLPRIHEILDGYDRPARAYVRPSREQAILWVLEQARPGDAVLIAGSDRACGIAGQRGRALGQDSEIARRRLYESPQATRALTGSAPHSG